MNYGNEGVQWSGHERNSRAVVGFTTDDGAFFFNHYLSTFPEIVNLAGQRLIYRLSLDGNRCVRNERCLSWYNEDVATYGIFPFWTLWLPPCPSNIFQAVRDFRFAFYSVRHSFQTTICYVSTFPQPFGAQTECCYELSSFSSFGSLIVGTFPGGSANLYHSFFNPQLHQRLDVRPFEDCCIDARFCQLYYRRRPSKSSFFYFAPFFGIAIVATFFDESLSNLVFLSRLVVW